MDKKWLGAGAAAILVAMWIAKSKEEGILLPDYFDEVSDDFSVPDSYAEEVDEEIFRVSSSVVASSVAAAAVGSVFKVGVIYIYGAAQGTNLPVTGWQNRINSKLSAGLGYFQSLMGRRVTYSFIGQKAISGNPVQLCNFQTRVPYNVVGQAYSAVRSDPNLSRLLPMYDCIFFVFTHPTNCGTCRCAFAQNYRSPVCFAEETIIRSTKFVVAHELLHCFGCPDHMHNSSWKAKYSNCIQGNPYLTTMMVCDECRAKLSWSNYKKGTI